MGVHGLRAYSTRKTVLPPIRENVHIFERILHWKLANQSRPKILIDLKDIVHMVVQARQLDNTIGGQYLLYTKFYQSLFKKFQRAEVDLVFFAPGHQLSDELETFIPNREADYIACISILDDIDANDGKWSRSVEPKCKKRAPLSLEFNMLKLAQQHGELHINYIRHSQEIAKYANANADTVLALITNSTEFLIFDGDYEVWRATDLTPTDMTAFRFCRKALREHLQLNTQQLELLAALSGTDDLPSEIIMDFYEKIGIERWNGGHIPALAKYVRDEVPLLATEQEGVVRFDLEKVAKDVFGEDYTREDLHAIENSLVPYNLNFDTNNNCRYKRASLDFCKTRNMFIFKLFTDEVFLVKDIRYIDFRHFKSKSYAELVVPLLRKMQGILYANEYRRPKTRAICMKYAHDEPYKVVEEPIIYPPAKIPELFDFVFKVSETKYDGIRWSTFDWMFEFGSNFENAFWKLDRKYIAAVVTIKYLLKQGEISSDEADAFMLTELFTRNANFVPKTIAAPKVLSAHFIRLSHLYTKMFCMICHCMEVCGLYSHTAMITFDAPYFHSTLNSLLSDKRTMADELRKIEPFRAYVD